MAQDFIDCGREQAFLMPASLRDWVAEDHLVWTVLEAVEAMDLSGFWAAYRADGHGGPAYEPSLVGWIQLVVATPEVEELLCRGETGLGIVPLQPERVGVDIRLPGGGSIGSGSGRRSLEVRQARRLRSRRVCCRALASGGFARVAVCRLSPSRPCPGVTCLSASGRRSRSCLLVVLGCGRPRVGSVGRRRRSPGSCNATPRLARAGLSIGPRPPRGMPSVALNVPSRQSSR